MSKEPARGDTAVAAFVVAVPPSSSVACLALVGLLSGDIGYPFLSLNTSFKLTLRPIGSSPGAHTEGVVWSPAGSALGAESAEMTGSGCSQEETAGCFPGGFMQNCFGAPQLFIEWVLGIIKAVSTHDFLPADKDQFFIRLQAEYFIRHQQRTLTQRVIFTIPRRIVL